MVLEVSLTLLSHCLILIFEGSSFQKWVKHLEK